MRWDETIVGTLPEKVLGTALLFAYLWWAGRGPTAIGLEPGGWRAGFVQGFALTLVLYLIAYGAPLGAYALQGAALSFRLEDPFTATGAALMMIMHVFNGLLEEGLFRGLLLRVFLRRHSPAVANLMQAALFGVWHFLWPVKWMMMGTITAAEVVPSMLIYGLITFLVGLFLGYWVLKTGSLWTVVVMHAVSGMVRVWLDGLRADGEMISDVTGYDVVLVTLLLLLAVWVRWRRREWRMTAWGEQLRPGC